MNTRTTLPAPLFDVKQTEVRRCSRKCPDRSRCDYDRDLEQGLLLAGKRPKSCLNSAQNRDGIPF